jgi:hypothetical protein
MPRPFCVSAVVAILLFIIAGIAVMVVTGCRDSRRSADTPRWDRIAEGENNELFFIDRKAIARVSDTVVKVSVKYVPSKDQFLVSLKELTKEFGKEIEDVEVEYTVSTWEFSCTELTGRCLSLQHFRKGSKIASYDYPDQRWISISSTNSTKVLRDLVCAEAARKDK